MGLSTDKYRRHSAKVTRTRRGKALRQQILRRDGYAFVKCGARGRLEVDHIAPVRSAPERSYDPANLQSLCPSCHTRKTRLECGHDPLNPERERWRAATRRLELARALPPEEPDAEEDQCLNP